MIEEEEWMIIRGLGSRVKEGISISEIIRLTGYDRKTVRKHLLAEEPPKYSTSERVSKLEPYKAPGRTYQNRIKNGRFYLCNRHYRLLLPDYHKLYHRWNQDQLSSPPLALSYRLCP